MRRARARTGSRSTANQEGAGGGAPQAPDAPNRGCRSARRRILPDMLPPVCSRSRWRHWLQSRVQRESVAKW
jgi:hypothetical protein